MRFLIFLLAFSTPYASIAQKHDHIWLLGYGGGSQSPPDDEFGCMLLDFNQPGEPAILEKQEYNMNFDGSNSNICDSAGNLLFYTNGEKIYNKTHKLMDNGSGIMIGDGFGYKLPQGSIAFPYPGHQNQFILLSVEDYPGGDAFGWKLYYHVIDMNQNNGLGKVVEKRKFLLQDSLAWGKLTAAKHANGRDWWIILPRDFSNKYYVGLLSDQGIQIDTVPVGEFVYDGLGQAVFSPDGTKYIRVDDKSLLTPAQISVMDFDRCTGRLSNYRTHFIDSPTSFGIGASVSPDSRYLYVFHTEVAYQYDLRADDIWATETLIGTFDGFPSGLYGSYYLFSQLGPDGRIYVGSWVGTFHWHKVHFPNRSGLGCQFVQHEIEFPVYMTEGMPNNPNYRLGPLDGSPCDTLGLDNHPLAGFRWDFEDTLSPLRVTFSDLSAYEPAAWHWDFGDGTTSADTSPVHLFPADGVYTVCLTVSNAYGADTLCYPVQVGVTPTATPPAPKPLDVRAYPNPFRLYLTLSVPVQPWERVDACLTDALGRIVARHAWRGDFGEWPLEDLPPGVYFYRVQSEGGREGVGKVVKW